MYKHILLAVDLNHESSWKTALPTAVEYARSFGASLTLLTVIPDFGMPMVGQFFPPGFEEKAQTKAEEALAAFAADHVPDGIDVHHVVCHGTPYEQILRTADRLDSDLIIVHAHRPELKDYLLGPTAARVVRHAGCSVLVVRDKNGE